MKLYFTSCANPLYRDVPLYIIFIMIHVLNEYNVHACTCAVALAMELENQVLKEEIVAEIEELIGKISRG